MQKLERLSMIAVSQNVDSGVEWVMLDSAVRTVSEIWREFRKGSCCEIDLGVLVWRRPNDTQFWSHLFEEILVIQSEVWGTAIRMLLNKHIAVTLYIFPCRLLIRHFVFTIYASGALDSRLSVYIKWLLAWHSYQKI